MQEKLLIGFMILIAACNCQSANCTNKISHLLEELKNFPSIPTDPNDAGVLLLSGKSVNDMGEKQLCEINPLYHYVTLSSFPAVIGLSIYKECSIADLNTYAPLIASILHRPGFFYDESYTQ